MHAPIWANKERHPIRIERVALRKRLMAAAERPHSISSPQAYGNEISAPGFQGR